MADNPYYYSFADYCKDTFGRRLYRVPVDAGFTCPNRDGKAGVGGCIFCGEAGSGEFAVKVGERFVCAEKTNEEKYDSEMVRSHTKYEGEKNNNKKADSGIKKCRNDLKEEKDNIRIYNEISNLAFEDIQYILSSRAKRDARPGDLICFFQSFTNTYADVSRLEALFRGALQNPLFAGISIATRPDCKGSDVLDLLDRLKHDFPEKFIWIELGLQTMHDRTAKLINRGYMLDTFTECMENLRALRLPVIVHVIIGLPGETANDVYETIDFLNGQGISGIKLSLLHIIKGTRLYDIYKTSGYLTDEEGNKAYVNVLDFDEYVDIVCGCLERLDKGIVVHRLTGDGDPKNLAAPLWSLEKGKVLNVIRKRLKEIKKQKNIKNPF